MSVICYTIKPESPWRTPLRSDTLHGLLLCALAEKEGEEAVEVELNAFLEGSPFTCSSAFPKDFLPMPCLPSVERDYFQVNHKKLFDSDLKDILQEYKVFLKKAFIPRGVFEQKRDNLSFKNLFLCYQKDKDSWDSTSFESHTEPHNTISRNSSIGLEGGLFFPTSFFHKQETLYNIYIESSKHKEIKSYLEYIGQVGFGADSSTGKGRFSLVDEEDVSALFKEKASNYSLMLGVSSAMDMSKVDGYYKVFTKKGRSWAQKSGISPFKKSFIALNEGAMLRSIPEQTMLKNLHADSSLVQLCHTLSLSCNIDKE